MAVDLDRRSVLKVLALTGATAAGCGKLPTRQLMPYVIPDEQVVPGVPTFFASACRECTAGCGVIARVREGRAIKLEGNPKDPIGRGALCARGQAALQGLYNPDRLAAPRARRPDGMLVSLGWDDALALLTSRLRASARAGPERVAFLGAPDGPTLDGVVERWLGVWRSSRRVVHEALGEEPALQASWRCFGRTDLPLHRIDTADVLVSFGADFLETWRSPVELTRQYAAFRAPRGSGGGLTVGNATYVGPRLGLTAANADEWIATRPGTEGVVALGVLGILARAGRLRSPGIEIGALEAFTAHYGSEEVEARTGVPPAQVRALAERLAAASAPVALAGTTDAATHVAVALINAVTGALGTTVRFHGESPRRQRTSRDVAALLEAMRTGGIDVLVVAGANPLFTLAAPMRAADAFARVPLVVWCGLVPDETAALAHLQLPVHHPLETWSDTEPRAGVRLLGQPVMQPVFETRPLGDVLLASAGETDEARSALPWPDTATAVEASWRAFHAGRADGTTFDEFWEAARRDGGFFEDVPAVTVDLRRDVLEAPLEIPAPAPLTLVAFPHLLLYDGRGADKPWLQEAPEPVSQIAWGTWAEIHPDTATRLGVGEGDVLALRSPQGAIAVPAHVSRGVHPDAVAVPLGQGHTAYGRYAAGRGANAWGVLAAGTLVARVDVRRTDGHQVPAGPIGITDMLGRPIIEAVRLEDLRLGRVPPRSGLEPPEPYEIRPRHVYPEHRWGMTIDLNACTGCSACVTACYAENNLPVVGAEEVARGHIMSWMRIERFVPEKADAPLLHIAPMLCQQCDNAPCEPVCPVYAAYHTTDGLNGQVYNRCIGTRYCNNNCPYKVRRFNWFKPAWPAPLQLQLNPDVTVRGAGVMEKCTFCVQRIRAEEMDASAEGRPVRDGDIVPACAQACPARAITFGDLNDPESAVVRRRTEQQPRGYRALEELNTEPAIVYLQRIYRRRDQA
jgi:anaerobic selenocysteine-containing dehydrogenase/Fe-S-cluster-containing dehydrogenase component